MCLQQLCHRCGYDPSFNEFSQRPWSSTIGLDTFMDGDIDRIQADIDQLERTTLHLKFTQAKLRRKINEIRSTPGKLPDEILSTIFSYACPVPARTSPTRGNRHFQIMLGAVSSRWHQVIWSTPGLWKGALMNVHSERLDHGIALLSLYVRNVGSYPFDLDFTFRDASCLQEEESLAELPAFRDLVFHEAAAKVRSLHPDFIPYRWITLLSNNFPKLEKLSMKTPLFPEQIFGTPESPSDDGIKEIVITGVPNLHHLHFITGFDPRIVFPWHQITVLHTWILPFYATVHLLYLCPNLQEVSIESSYAKTWDQFDWRNALSRQSIKLDRLVHLRYTPSMQACDVFRRLHFPHLNKLHWFSVGYDDPVTRRMILGEVLRPMPTVTCFTAEAKSVGEAISDAVGWKEIFTTYLPNLTRLELRAFELLPQTVLAILDSTSELNSGDLVLPRLEHFILEIRSYTKKSAKRSRTLLVDLVKMLQERRQVSSEFLEFTLMVSEEIAKSRGRNVRKQLKKLVEEGLRLTIMVESKPVDWLQR